MDLLIHNARLVLQGGGGEGSLLVRDGKISGVFTEAEQPTGLGANQRIDLAGAYLGPGLIDIHIHGSHAIDVLNATGNDLVKLADSLLQDGITGYVPTLVPVGENDYQRTIGSIRAAIDTERKGGRDYSRVLGVHFEGPFVSEKKCGALHREFFRTYDGPGSSLEMFRAPALSSAEHGVPPCRLMTIAPEVTGGIALIQELSRSGVRCFIGHTAADFETLGRALSAGAVHITHFPNALEPLHHRRPGAVAWGLLTREVSLDTIADYHHVHPEVLKLIYRMKGATGMALISDAIPPTCLPEGEYVVWGDRIEIKDGRTRLVSQKGSVPTDGEGTIAGSVITLRQAVVNAIGIGIPVHEAVSMASMVPANAAGMDRWLGSIEPGKVANLIAFDQAVNVKLVMVEGEIRVDQRS
ncbi:MAG TPA: N-acetylglucosamine-6-phosphate deacetylase [Blastocatellia bacterium]|nr:N-acetylglucosamine-6-phosphate deacetylase [Blastocatellia bacterium]